MLNITSFFDLTDFPDSSFFDGQAHPWQPLRELKNYMNSYDYPQYMATGEDHPGNGLPRTEHIIIHDGQAFSSKDIEIDFGDVSKGNLRVTKRGAELRGASVIMAGAVIMGKQISIGKGVLVETGAMIKSPAIIGDYTEVRQGAYLRGYCLTGKRCVIGHATEVKHSIFLNDAKAGHFAYLGDSILGGDANLGAGTKFANLKFFPGNVTITVNGEKIDSGLRKFGAILGDRCQTGCNSVTNPGTVMAKAALLMPNTTAPGGYHKPRSIIR